MKLTTTPTPELELPAHLQADRVKRDFGPFLRLCRDAAPAKHHKALERQVMGWLLSLPHAERERLKGQLIISFAGPRREHRRPTTAAYGVATDVYEMFKSRFVKE